MSEIEFSVASELELSSSTTHQNLRTIKKVNTPFGYFGSKNKIALQLCQELPLHNCWVEGFCGSAALTLAKRQSPIEVINDIDGEIINVFQQLRDNVDEISRLVTLTPYSRTELELARISNPNDSKEERARKFLVQAMMAVNGVFGEVKGGFSYSQSYSRNSRDARVNRWCNLPERLVKVVERLRNVRIENRNAVELLKMFRKRPATLVYLDPPYLGERSAGYSIDANDANFHETMLKEACKSKAMVFISGYENELYSDVLTDKRGWSKRTIDTHTKGVNGNGHHRKEVVWTNKHFNRTQNSGKLGLRLTKKELKENKVNPERTS